MYIGINSVRMYASKNGLKYLTTKAGFPSRRRNILVRKSNSTLLKHICAQSIFLYYYMFPFTAVLVIFRAVCTWQRCLSQYPATNMLSSYFTQLLVLNNYIYIHMVVCMALVLFLHPAMLQRLCLSWTKNAANGRFNVSAYSGVMPCNLYWTIPTQTHFNQNITQTKIWYILLYFTFLYAWYCGLSCM